MFDGILEKMMGAAGEAGPQNKLDPINDAGDQSQDELKIVAWIQNKVEEARGQAARVAFESQVVTNTAYALGYDSVYFDARSRSLRPLGTAGGWPKKSRVHENLILPTIQNRLARLCKNPPRYEVRPNSNAQEDRDAARLTAQLILSTMERERASEKRIELYMWMQQAGHAFIKVFWDPDKGPETPGMDGDDLSGVEKLGDISLDVVSPLEMFWDPLAKSTQDAQWAVHAKVRKLSYFRERYPERGHLVKEEGAWLLSTQNLLKIQNMNTKGSAAEQQNQMKNAAIEIAYYERPSKKHPNGRQIVVANGILLEEKDLPIGEIPYVKFDDVKIGGKFFSESIITHMRPIQDQYNRNLRKKAEFLNKALAAKILAAKGHGMSSESVNDTTEVIQYNPVPGGSEPKAMNTPQLPQYVYTDSESLKMGLGNISGINEASQGQMPSASIPAIGMQMLVEQDETRIGIVTESNENSWADVGRMIAKFAYNFYKTPRLIKESGEEGEHYVNEFTGSDLREHFDVVVVRGSTLPGSKVLRRQELLNLYQQGLMGDPMDPAVKSKVLQNLEYGDVEEVWNEISEDMMQIKRDIDEIERGIRPEVSDDNNAQLHYKEKNRIRKSQKFQDYPILIKEIFMENFIFYKNIVFPPPPPMPPMDVPMGPPPPPPPGPPGMDIGPEETIEDEEQVLEDGGAII